MDARRGRTPFTRVRFYVVRVLQELFSQKHASVSRPFCDAAEAQALGVKPSLASVRSTLLSGGFPAIGPFAVAVRDVFANCYLTHGHPDRSALSKKCERIDAVFEQQIFLLPKTQREAASLAQAPTSLLGGADAASSSTDAAKGAPLVLGAAPDAGEQRLDASAGGDAASGGGAAGRAGARANQQGEARAGDQGRGDVGDQHRLLGGAGRAPAFVRRRVRLPLRLVLRDRTRHPQFCAHRVRARSRALYGRLASHVHRTLLSLLPVHAHTHPIIPTNSSPLQSPLLLHASLSCLPLASLGRSSTLYSATPTRTAALVQARGLYRRWFLSVDLRCAALHLDQVSQRGFAKGGEGRAHRRQRAVAASSGSKVCARLSIGSTSSCRRYSSRCATTALAA